MNALLCKPYVTTDAQLNIYEALGPQEDFTTAPMQAICATELVERSATPLDEEELHISFEEAISNRLSALSVNRGHSGSTFIITEPLQSTACVRATTHQGSNIPAFEQETLLGTGWQRYFAYICMALMFMLIGFDLMGLLFLHLH